MTRSPSDSAGTPVTVGPATRPAAAGLSHGLRGRSEPRSAASSDPARPRPGRGRCSAAHTRCQDQTTG
eukprot:763834-Hanusia_phi.AAC.3